jgi:hypothetical protein
MNPRAIKATDNNTNRPQVPGAAMLLYDYFVCCFRNRAETTKTQIRQELGIGAMAMADIPNCSDLVIRGNLQSLLEETHPWPTWSFVDQALVHLSECAGCQNDFAYAKGQLYSLRQQLEDGARERISFLRKSYLASKYAAEVADDEHSQSQLLAHLAAAGDDLGAVLWSVNTSHVPWQPFSPLVSSEDDYTGEHIDVTVGLSTFFATLSQEDQEFVVAAAAASEVLIKPWDVEEDERLIAINKEADSWKQSVLLYELAIDDSTISPTRLRIALEHGAGGIAKEYVRFAKNHADRNTRSRRASTHRAGTPIERSVFDELRSELLRSFGDFEDSMKAGQMELIRLAEGKNSGPDPEVFLLEALGSELYSNLVPATKYLLRASEVAYRNPRSGYEEQFATLMLVQAYEAEFDARITQPLGKQLIFERYGDFPQEGSVRLVQGKRLNDRITAAQVLNLLSSDRHLQEILRERGLKWEIIVGTGRPVTVIRNKVAHRDYRPEHAQSARDLVLGPKGAFKALFLASGDAQNKT